MIFINSGTSLIYAESQLGGLLAKIDKSDSKLKGNRSGSNKGTTTNKSLPSGINKKMSHEAQTLHVFQKMHRRFLNGVSINSGLESFSLVASFI